MRVIQLLIVTVMAGISFSASATLLTGDTKLACEATLCLSTGSRPSECDPPIKRYLSIKHKKFKDTLKARRDFLNLCPSSSAPGMPALVNAIVSGADVCDASTLNSRLATTDETGATFISNTLPAECVAYITNPYVKLSLHYVGDPATGGHWVD